MSLSVRRAWIEIQCRPLTSLSSVSLSVRRAWIEISLGSAIFCLVMSLSVRRAWIEIGMSGLGCRVRHVALRKESVDRNLHLLFLACYEPWSLSVRRAWIEMSMSQSRPILCAGRSP